MTITKCGWIDENGAHQVPKDWRGWLRVAREYGLFRALYIWDATRKGPPKALLREPDV